MQSITDLDLWIEISEYDDFIEIYSYLQDKQIELNKDDYSFVYDLILEKESDYPFGLDLDESKTVIDLNGNVYYNDQNITNLLNNSEIIKTYKFALEA